MLPVGRICLELSIRWVVCPIAGGHVLDGKGVDTIEAPDIESVLVRGRAGLVVGVDAAIGAEVVLRHLAVELVGLEVLGALEDA